MDFIQTVFGSAFDAEKQVAGFLLPSREATWFTDAESLAQFGESNKGSQDVYVGCCVVDSPSEQGHRHSADDVTGLVAVWADIDIQSPQHSHKDLPSSREEAIQKISKAGLPQATIYVNSGYGLHGWWVLKELEALSTPEDRKRATELVAGFQAALRSAVGRLDSTYDLARVLRLPGTLNHKRKPVPVEVMESSTGGEYTSDELREFSPADFHVETRNSSPKLSGEPEYPQEKVTGLIAFDDDFRKTWKKERTKQSFPSKQDSQSEYDMAVANICAQAGFSREEIVGTLKEFRRIHGEKDKHDGYYAMTAEKGFDGINEERATEVVEEYAYLGDKVNKDKLIECVQQKLGVPITGVVKYLGDPPTFTLKTTVGDIHVGNVDGLISQNKLRSSVAATCGQLLKKMKPREFNVVAQMLLDIAVEEDIGDESKDAGLMLSMLRSYLDDNGIAEDATAALATGSPFVYDGKLMVLGSDFSKYLYSRGHRVSRKEMGRMLRQAGAYPHTVAVKTRKNKASTRSAWVLPDFE